MRKLFFTHICLLLIIIAQAQKTKVTVGPELLTSFNHDPSFFGVGGSAQLDIWIKERLWLGVNSGYLNFKSTKALPGSGTRPSYGAIPVLG
ncbi:MAG TPA: hypothetical protein VL943_03035, partial [Niabella sp.]|nr:hypothetical protein [Niabella sp.]